MLQLLWTVTETINRWFRVVNFLQYCVLLQISYCFQLSL